MASEGLREEFNGTVPLRGHEANKGPICRENPPYLLVKTLSSSGMGEKIIKPAFGKACSAKSDFRFTAFSEVAGYQCDSTAAWPSVGALVLGLPSVGVLAAELDSLP